MNKSFVLVIVALMSAAIGASLSYFFMVRRARTEAENALDRGLKRFGVARFTIMSIALLGGALVLLIAAADAFERRSVVVGTLPPRDTRAPGWEMGILYTGLAVILMAGAGMAAVQAVWWSTRTTDARSAGARDESQIG